MMMVVSLVVEISKKVRVSSLGLRLQLAKRVLLIVGLTWWRKCEIGLYVAAFEKKEIHIIII